MCVSCTDTDSRIITMYFLFQIKVKEIKVNEVNTNLRIEEKNSSFASGGVA